MALQQSKVDPLIEKFAKACSDDYSLAVDRKDSIIAYVTGASDDFPDMLTDSNRFLYRTIEALDKLERGGNEDVFARAAAVLLRTMGSGNAYQGQTLYRICVGGWLSGVNLGARRIRDMDERRAKSLERLRLLHRYAGEGPVQKLFRMQIGVSRRAAKYMASPETSADTLLLLKLYTQIDPGFAGDMLNKLPDSLRALFKEDPEALRREFMQAIEPLAIRQLPLKDTLTQLDLDEAYVRERRDAVKKRLFANSGLNPKEQLKREQQNAVLTQLRMAFYYVLLQNGGKEGLLESSSELDAVVLEAVRTVHEILPLEVRAELLSMENTGKDPDLLLQGIVPIDEPFAAITTLAQEIDSYMPAWNTLRAELLKDPERSKRLFALLRRPMLKAYVYRVLADEGMAPESEGGIEKLVLDALADKLHGNTLGQSLAKVLTGDLSLEAYIKNKAARDWDDVQGNDIRRRNLLIAVTLLPEDSELYAKFVKVVGHTEIGTANVLTYLYKSPAFSGENLLELAEVDSDADGESMLRRLLMLNGLNQYSYGRVPDEELRGIVRQRLAASLDLYAEAPGEVRQIILEAAFSGDEESEKSDDSAKKSRRADGAADEDLLVRALGLGLGDSSKRIKELSRAELLRRPDKDLYVKLYLAEKKAAVRETVIDLLRGLEGEGEAYKQLLQKEKSAALKARLQALLDTLGQPAEFAHAALAEHADAKKLARLSWLPLDRLPELRGKDGHRLAEGIRTYILTESVDFVSEPNPRLDEVAEYADAESLTAFTAEALRLWIDEGAPPKEKWVLPLAARFGGRSMVDLLGKQIKDWTDSSRGAIAAEAVRALAYTGDTAALMTIDRLGRTIKNRQVKGAAEEALQLAADNLGLTKEQLADRLVTTLGFDGKGELELSYGERSFTVKVNADLQLSAVSGETGKAVKSLPAPGQKDDAELAAKSKARFTQLKKDLKNMVGIQSQRLEESLSKRRLWSAPEWKELFVGNVIMRQFAVGLIWGVYTGSGEETAVSETFRYMEDGTFNTVDEDEYELAENAVVGLVHPLELDKDTLGAWKTQLDDYEIAQPFIQLDRPVYEPEEDDLERRTYSRLPEGDYSPTGFPKALEKYGWVKGRAQDGGFYNELFKEYGELIARLTFSGTSISYYEGMEDVTLEELEFFGNKGDDYYYTPLSGYPLKKVPDRVFSETVYDILRASGQES
ncbi:DUF4132 domain-containing protein [Saccharibacillus sp. CPCC 101409]|uniref:DUF4132 domain-containing protein n=1 Tax=Saccharibacillus sp. CPCC 101409 TaxID=3058041 RepID=UPI002673ED2A|nr:DUF4132 domain-containing protein [Saccharibacillus sp. CPCC 101409]MDO3411419.1 DUF4132 domain-containing protein [Saccharibacillus sp. CPCC 101409]